MRRHLIAFHGLVKREVERCFRLWAQTFLPPVITSALYFLIFGYILGARVGDMQGFNYTMYIVPGLVMMPLIMNAYNNVVSSLFGTRFQGAIEEMLVAPIANWAIVSGFVAGGVVRAFVVGFLVFLVALFFTHVHIAHPIFCILIALLAAMMFAAAGFINAVYARKFDDVVIVPTFILTPLIYLGGVFYSVAALPEGERWLCYADPIYYIVSLFRYAILGVDNPHIAFSLFLIVAMTAGLLGCAWWQLATGRVKKV